MSLVLSIPGLAGFGLASEFFGALLTGISFGAPYWHDLLRVLSRLRSPTPAGGEAVAVRGKAR